MKITDVSSVVREIIVERLKDYGSPRNEYKFPTVEDQARIQKELGMVIDFSFCIKSGNCTDINWSMPIEGRQLPFSYISYISMDDVYSTMDEDYAIVIVSLFFRKPKHIAIAYGPKELINIDRFMIKSTMSIQHEPKKDI